LTLFISPFTIFYRTFCKLSSSLGAYLDILEDKNSQRENKYYRQRGDKIVKEKIKLQIFPLFDKWQINNIQMLMVELQMADQQHTNVDGRTTNGRSATTYKC